MTSSCLRERGIGVGNWQLAKDGGEKMMNTRVESSLGEASSEAQCLVYPTSEEVLEDEYDPLVICFFFFFFFFLLFFLHLFIPYLCNIYLFAFAI